MIPEKIRGDVSYNGFWKGVTYDMFDVPILNLEEGS